jgi:hypothetical protein
MWYRTLFSVPERWAVDAFRNRVQLNFQAVDWYTEVWVDGSKLGEHFGG